MSPPSLENWNLNFTGTQSFITMLTYSFVYHHWGSIIIHCLVPYNSQNARHTYILGLYNRYALL